MYYRSPKNVWVPVHLADRVGVASYGETMVAYEELDTVASLRAKETQHISSNYYYYDDELPTEEATERSSAVSDVSATGSAVSSTGSTVSSTGSAVSATGSDVSTAGSDVSTAGSTVSSTGSDVSTGSAVSGRAKSIKIIPVIYRPKVVKPTPDNVDLVKSSVSPSRFLIKQPFSLPVPFATKPIKELLQTEWVKELQAFLTTVTAGPITIVSSDYNYRDVLLNWLISATIKVKTPPSNILVLSLDESLYRLLQAREIPCIHIAPASLIAVKITGGHAGFRQVHITRLTVMRLINHWGYDVANYDTDAIILKNLEPLIYRFSKDVDLIGSYGAFPQLLRNKWGGVAVCIGVVILRSSPQTG